MQKLIPLMLCLALLSACGSEDEPQSAAPAPAEQKKALEGAPPALAKVGDQANELLGGGVSAYRERIEGLEGYPVVVNKWASWCGPCRAEFPYFQSQAIKRGKQVAFLGVNSNDNDKDAAKFLKEFPVAFPSYIDGDLKVAAEMKAVAAFPSTTFYDREGKIAYVKQGGYATEQKLIEDIERYAR